MPFYVVNDSSYREARQEMKKNSVMDDYFSSELLTFAANYM